MEPSANTNQKAISSSQTQKAGIASILHELIIVT